MNKILSIVFLGLVAINAFAETAEVRHGFPKYDKVLKITPEGKLTGKLADLETWGGGEDEEFVLLCFNGEVKAVCDLLTAATKEMNLSEKINPSEAFILKTCELNEDGNIKTSFARKSKDKKLEGFRLMSISPCKK